jgi:hypothetical protein
MNLLRKNAITSGTFAALVLLTALPTSTPARAFGASLVGGIHQTGLPVITATIPVPSSKIVTLATGVEPGAGLFPLHLVSSEGEAVAGYVVPAGHHPISEWRRIRSCHGVSGTDPVCRIRILAGFKSRFNVV